MTVWTILYFNDRVRREIADWPVGVYADFLRLAEWLEVDGLTLRMPHSRAMSGGLFELRCKGPEAGSQATEGRSAMSKEGFKPVRHDAKAALDTAMQRPGFREAWEASAEDYAALRSLLEARKQSGLTQEEIAIRMGTSKSAVSRLESSLRDPRHSPTFETIRRYAKACGKRVALQLV